jgi:hypothetical protein
LGLSTLQQSERLGKIRRAEPSGEDISARQFTQGDRGRNPQGHLSRIKNHQVQGSFGIHYASMHALGAAAGPCVQPEMVVEVSDAQRTPDGLLRHVVYLGEREDKPAIEVRRDRPS